MSPEDDLDLEKLILAERVITALETMTPECDARELTVFAKALRDCIATCQADYIKLHRRLYKKRGGPPEPSETEH